jgi:hypothetical protein
MQLTSEANTHVRVLCFGCHILCHSVTPVRRYCTGISACFWLSFKTPLTILLHDGVVISCRHYIKEFKSETCIVRPFTCTLCKFVRSRIRGAKLAENSLLDEVGERRKVESMCVKESRKETDMSILCVEFQSWKESNWQSSKNGFGT